MNLGVGRRGPCDERMALGRRWLELPSVQPPTTWRRRPRLGHQRSIPGAREGSPAGVRAERPVALSAPIAHVHLGETRTGGMPPKYACGRLKGGEQSHGNETQEDDPLSGSARRLRQRGTWGRDLIWARFPCARAAVASGGPLDGHGTANQPGMVKGGAMELPGHTAAPQAAHTPMGDPRQPGG